MALRLLEYLRAPTVMQQRSSSMTSPCWADEVSSMITLREYLRRQLEEGCSAENRWYCSEFYGYEVTDPQVLLEYYIKHGGSKDFADGHRNELGDSRG
jgi:hypothetical protein